MVSLLCMNDRTHSNLFDFIPAKYGVSISLELFDAVLFEVAQYSEPRYSSNHTHIVRRDQYSLPVLFCRFEAGGNMQQGMFLPKPEVWENHYDPIHVLLRAVHRRDFQASLERFNVL